MNGFTKRTQIKMENIEETTLSLLRLDFNEIKIADIAKKAKVSQVSIYNYYGSKEKLIEAAVERLVNQQIQRLENIIAADLPFKEKLNQFFSLKRQIAGNFNIYIAAKDKKLGELLATHYNKTVPLFIKFIQIGKQTGNIRDCVKDEVLIFYLKMIGQSLLHLHENEILANGPENLSEGILDLLLYGILNEDK